MHTSKRKCKIADERRVFNEDWTSKYFFTDTENKTVSLLCQETIVVLNTKITAFLTFLELPQAVKMTVCPIKKKLGNNLALFYLVSFLTFVVYLVMTRIFVGMSLVRCRLLFIIMSWIILHRT